MWPKSPANSITTHLKDRGAGCRGAPCRTWSRPSHCCKSMCPPRCHWSCGGMFHALCKACLGLHSGTLMAGDKRETKGELLPRCMHALSATCACVPSVATWCKAIVWVRKASFLRQHASGKREASMRFVTQRTNTTVRLTFTAHCVELTHTACCRELNCSDGFHQPASSLWYVYLWCARVKKCVCQLTLKHTGG